MYFGFRIPLKTFVPPFLSTRLTAPGSPRMTKRIQIPNRLLTWKMPGRFSNDRVLEVKQQILHVYHAFWYISIPWPRREIFFMRRCLEDMEMNFSFSVQGAVPKDSTPVKFTYICRFEQVGINSEKFGKTRIRFNWDLFPTLAINIFKVPYNVTFSFWFNRKLLWSKEKSIMIRWNKGQCNNYLEVVVGGRGGMWGFGLEN